MEQKLYCFLDNLIWIGNDNLSLLLLEYTYLPVNLLSSSPQISDLIKYNFFYFKFAQNDEKVG